MKLYDARNSSLLILSKKILPELDRLIFPKINQVCPCGRREKLTVDVEKHIFVIQYDCQSGRHTDRQTSAFS